MHLESWLKGSKINDVLRQKLASSVIIVPIFSRIFIFSLLCYTAILYCRLQEQNRVLQFRFGYIIVQHWTHFFRRRSMSKSTTVEELTNVNLQQNGSFIDLMDQMQLTTPSCSTRLIFDTRFSSGTWVIALQLGKFSPTLGLSDRRVIHTTKCVSTPWSLLPHAGEMSSDRPGGWHQTEMDVMVVCDVLRRWKGLLQSWRFR